MIDAGARTRTPPGTGFPGMPGAGAARWVFPLPVFYLATALVAAVLFGVGLVAYHQGALPFYRHNAPLLALVHLFVLGFGTTLTLGVLHQMVPVLLDVRLHSTRLGYVAYVHHVLGVTVLVASFARFFLQGVALGGALVVAGFAVAAYNLYRTLTQNRSWNLTARYLAFSLGYLGLTVLMGLTMAINLRFTFLPGLLAEGLPIHLLWGVGGWFFLTIVGVSYKLIPMFTLTHNHPEGAGRAILVLAQAGIWTAALGAAQGWPGWVKAAGMALLGVAGLLYAWDLLRILRHRLRRRLEPVHAGAVASAGQLALAIGAMAAGAARYDGLDLAGQNRLAVGVGLWVGLGFVAGMILAILTKLVPFMAWNQVYRNRVAGGAPLLRQMLDERRAWTGLALLHLGTVGTALSVLLGGAWEHAHAWAGRGALAWTLHRA
ncbi:hypothetical protein [Limnochorda pilosa]|uniref:Uncharacterized protein n=1 Tax=Limnochorda pilosa TaxID=1555112 RepID=A0A0K2SPX0_LIMPI|nr:hypothetical protein [Limnochorda pilosa]BAS29163.1 hypothetical protein LIP_3351 [Limnochorda pilosa]